jgi:hypothetical protein
VSFQYQKTLKADGGKKGKTAARLPSTRIREFPA